MNFVGCWVVVEVVGAMEVEGCEMEVLGKVGEVVILG